MHLSKLLLVWILLTFELQCLSQNKFLGVKLGYIPTELSESYTNSSIETAISIGVKTEYAPKKGIFSMSAEIHYLSRFEKLLIPLAFNLRFGPGIKFRISAGLVPNINLMKSISPSKFFSIGTQLGFGLEVPIHKQLSIFGEAGNYILPFFKYDTSPGGLRSIDRLVFPFLYFHLGIQRDFGKSK